MPGPSSIPDPASLNIVNYPHPALRTKALPLEQVTPSVLAIADRMIELMRQAEGIGLAAPQVGLPWRLFVVEVPEDAEELRLASSDPPQATTGPMVLINPTLSTPDGNLEPFDEGCLSLPDIRGTVLRPSLITVTALDRTGKPFILRAGGLLARCLQHESDHLDGVLIIDKMNQMSRLKNRLKLRTLERSAPM